MAFLRVGVKGDLLTCRTGGLCSHGSSDAGSVPPVKAALTAASRGLEKGQVEKDLGKHAKQEEDEEEEEETHPPASQAWCRVPVTPALQMKAHGLTHSTKMLEHSTSNGRQPG